MTTLKESIISAINRAWTRESAYASQEQKELAGKLEKDYKKRRDEIIKRNRSKIQAKKRWRCRTV